MNILAIETSCDDTCAAVLNDDRILSNVVSSQTNLHKKWGGVVPDIAKRAHQKRIEPVIMEALSKGFNLPKSLFDKRDLKTMMAKIDVIAVTKGPGLAIALSVGVNKAKELAIKYNKKLVAVNHVEGHIMANWAKNSKGLPERNIELPALAMTVSGGHTKLIVIKSPPNPLFDERGGMASFEYQVVGETLDDAAGEALDKAAKLMGFGYPGGPIIEKLAESGDINFLELPRPMADKKILDYSFSGLKTSFYYKIKDWPKEMVIEKANDLAASYQNAVFDMLLRKFKLAAEKYEPKTLLASGGVMANKELRKRIRKLAKELKLPVYMPNKKILDTDNAGMIGVAGYFMALKEEWADPETLDRDPRMNFNLPPAPSLTRRGV